MSTVPVQRASTPTALTQSLYDYMNKLSNKIAQRAFKLFEEKGGTHGHDLEDWLTAEAEFLTPVPVELSETDADLIVRAKVSGFTEKDLEIIAEPERLFITGKTETKSEKKKKQTLHSEFSSSEIFRSIRLPAAIDPEKVSAVLKSGVLEVAMHKAKPDKRVTITAEAA